MSGLEKWFPGLFSPPKKETICPIPSLFNLQQADGQIVNIPCGKIVIIHQSEEGFVSFVAPVNNVGKINSFCRNPGYAGASICLYQWNPQETDVNTRLGLNLYSRQDSQRIPLLLQGDKVLVAIDIEYNVLSAVDTYVRFIGPAQLANRHHVVKQIPEKSLVQEPMFGRRIL